MFSGCCVLLFSIFEESFRAPRELVRWLNWKGSHIPTHIFIYILAFVSTPQTTSRTATMVVIYHLALSRSMIVAIEQIDITWNQLHWLRLLHASYIFLLRQAGKGRVFCSADKCFETGVHPRNIFEKQILKVWTPCCWHFTAWSRARLWSGVWKLCAIARFSKSARARTKNYREPP